MHPSIQIQAVQIKQPTVSGGESKEVGMLCGADCCPLTAIIQASLSEMIAPGALVLLTPLVVGTLFGTRTLAGVLAGALVSGVQMAVSMSNTGGAWDNAKKYVEVSCCANLHYIIASTIFEKAAVYTLEFQLHSYIIRLVHFFVRESYDLASQNVLNSILEHWVQVVHEQYARQESLSYCT